MVNVSEVLHLQICIDTALNYRIVLVSLHSLFPVPLLR